MRFEVAHTFGNRLREIFIYRDEAGYFVGNEWIIWEAADHPSSKELCEEFINALRDQVVKEAENSGLLE